jgi:hypothetical protein
MRKPKCPVCNREVPRAHIRKGTFQCPSCGTGLRIPETFRQPFGLLFFASGVGAAFFVARVFGAKGNSLLLAVALLMTPCALGIACVCGAILAAVFPRLERGTGVDRDGNLHIVPPPGPPTGRQ